MSVDQVRVHCKKLVRAVMVIMDPESSAQHRLEALKMCDGFKQECPFCIPCGLKLAEKTQPDVIRHFGLQIIEHVVKFRWKFIFPQDKESLKKSVMELMSNGTKHISEEESHIKNVIVRIVVELVKLEWPQKWPDLLDDLKKLSTEGETQTELVLLILLRLAEDFVTFQTLPSQLIYLKFTLNANMKTIFDFMKSVLLDIVKKYRCLTQQYHHVGVATLDALAGYLDWVAINHITDDNCKLLEMLCFLLDESEVQLEAAECLCIIINRTGKMEDRRLLMFLFEDVPMHYILSAVQTTDGKQLTEKSYFFLKRLSNVMCALASLLCTLVGSDINVTIPDNFEKYLDSLLKFTTHSSMFLRSSVQSTWKAFLKHKIFSTDTVLLTKFPKYLQATTTNLLKVGFPSKNDSPSCEYSRLDFDSDEDFIEFFRTFCLQQGEVVKVACQLAPRTSFRMASEWLKCLLSAAVDTGSVKSQDLHATSASTLKWDAMTFFFECVIHQITQVLSKEDIPVDDGIKVLQLLLKFETNNPFILSCVLKIMHTLFPFLNYRSEYLLDVLNKLFGVVEHNKGPRIQALKNARGYACSCIKELCQSNAELVLPNLEMLFNQVKQMLGNELMLTPMEKSTLMEALISVSNELKEYEPQKEFLEELMAPVASLWLSQEMKRVLSDPDAFIQYVGANSQTTDVVLPGFAGLNRSRMSFCVSTILGVLKEARWPSDLEEAKAGGFVTGCMPNGNPIYRNPCADQVMKLLDNLLALISTQHILHTPEVFCKLGGPFANALYRSEVKKTSVEDVSHPLRLVSDALVYKTEFDSIEDFVYTLYLNCFKLLGLICVYVSKDFYAMTNLANLLLQSAFSNLENVPDYRLSLIIRLFVKPLLLFCPLEEYQTILSPILGPFLTSLHEGLSARWDIIDQRIKENEENTMEGQHESQEMEEELQIRLLTRVVMKFIDAFCVSMKASDSSVLDEESDDEDVMQVEPTQPCSGEPKELSEMGIRLMQEEDICSALLITVFASLTWNDSLTCQRTATRLCWPLLKQVNPVNLLPDAVQYFYTMVLKGLQVHGDYYYCRVDLVQLAFQIYDTLRPNYSELRRVMEKVPSIDRNSLKDFDVALVSKNKPDDETRKINFRRLIKGCIGKRV